MKGIRYPGQPRRSRPSHDRSGGEVKGFHCCWIRLANGNESANGNRERDHVHDLRGCVSLLISCGCEHDFHERGEAQPRTKRGQKHHPAQASVVGKMSEAWNT